MRIAHFVPWLQSDLVSSDPGVPAGVFEPIFWLANLQVNVVGRYFSRTWTRCDRVHDLYGPTEATSHVYTLVLPPRGEADRPDRLSRSVTPGVCAGPRAGARAGGGRR